jgi:hypothetical protein
MKRGLIFEGCQWHRWRIGSEESDEEMVVSSEGVAEQVKGGEHAGGGMEGGEC